MTTTVRVPIKPAIIRWALERADIPMETATKRFPTLPQWIDESKTPTRKQFRDFAKMVRTSWVFLLGDEPPELKLDIPDMRTHRNAKLHKVSANLYNHIQWVQHRQQWQREYLELQGAPNNKLFGTYSLNDEPAVAAATAKKLIGLPDELQSIAKSADGMYAALRAKLEEAGINVMSSGCAAGITSDTFKPGEFRGFCLADPVAPIIFVNTHDAQTARVFTLIHELGHLMLGGSAISESELNTHQGEEQWCNKFAAEFLVPRKALLEKPLPDQFTVANLDQLAQIFRVSPFVILIRLQNLNSIASANASALYAQLIERSKQKASKSGGGSFYRNRITLVGRRLSEDILDALDSNAIDEFEAADLLGLASPDKIGQFIQELDAISSSKAVG